MIEGGRTQAHERLRRLLFLVPYISRNQGQKVDDVARAAGLTRAELLEELDLLTMVGRPPFDPGDYIDVYVEDDEVFIELDQRLSAPPRLTAAEGVALAAAAALLKPAEGGALAHALQRLEAVLPPQAAQRYASLTRQLDIAASAPDTVTSLTRAVSERLEIEFEYRALSHGGAEHRRARPLELFSHRGQWYLSAFCLTRNGPRLFRVDRLDALSVTDARFDATELPPRPGFSAAEQSVRVRFEPRLAAWQKERFGDSAQPQPDGSLVVSVPGDSRAWLARWVLSFGGGATVLEPEWAKSAVAEAARASLQSL